MQRRSVVALLILAIGAIQAWGPITRGAGVTSSALMVAAILVAAVAALIPKPASVVAGGALSIAFLVAARMASASPSAEFPIPGPAVLLLAGWLLERRARHGGAAGRP